MESNSQCISFAYYICSKLPPLLSLPSELAAVESKNVMPASSASQDKTKSESLSPKPSRSPVKR